MCVRERERREEKKRERERKLREKERKKERERKRTRLGVEGCDLENNRKVFPKEEKRNGTHDMRKHHEWVADPMRIIEKKNEKRRKKGENFHWKGMKVKRKRKP